MKSKPEPAMSSSSNDNKQEAPPPKEPDGDGFPAEKDVSAPPPGSDQSKHADKKR